MEITTITLTKLTPATGMVLTQKADSVTDRIYSTEMYLAPTDSADNYKEITEEEAKKLQTATTDTTTSETKTV